MKDFSKFIQETILCDPNLDNAAFMWEELLL